MKRLVAFFVVTIVVVSSVCGACAFSYKEPSKAISNNTVVSDEWTIEFSNTTTVCSNDNDCDLHTVDVTDTTAEFSTNDEWTIQI